MSFVGKGTNNNLNIQKNKIFLGNIVLFILFCSRLFVIMQQQINKQRIIMGIIGSFIIGCLAGFVYLVCIKTGIARSPPENVINHKAENFSYW